MKLANLLRLLYRSDNYINKNELIKLLNLKEETLLIDVRSIQEYNEGHLPNAINIPVYDIEKNAEKLILNKEQKIITYCSMGIRSKKAAKVLKKLGYKNVYAVNEGVV